MVLDKCQATYFTCCLNTSSGGVTMVDTGVDAREIIVIIRPERPRSLPRRRSSPATAAIYRPNLFYPLVPFCARYRQGQRARLVSALVASARAVCRAAAFRVQAFGESKRDLPNRYTNLSFSKLPSRPRWGHSSTTRRGEEIPLVPKDGERDTGASLSFKKRRPGAGMVPSAFIGKALMWAVEFKAGSRRRTPRRYGIAPWK